MKLWKLAATISIGVWASGSGMLQVSAAEIVFGVDFDEKIVTDFDDYDQTFINTTNNLDNNMEVTVQLTYRMLTCPAPVNDTDVRVTFRYRLNNNAPTFNLPFVDLPDLPCSTTTASYFNTATASLPLEHLVRIIDDDNDFLSFRPTITFRRSASMVGRTIEVDNLNFLFTLNYDFNTTYLFNYFLSDTQFTQIFKTDNVFNLVDPENYFNFVSTTAGNDTYFIFNDNNTDYGTTRNKFAIDYENEYFRGTSVGARHTITMNDFFVIISASTDQIIESTLNYYYLNISNKSVPLADVPQFEFEEEDCGSFLALNVGCFINNGLAYITNDAPIISDIFTLLNVGMQLGGQAFSVLGNFTDNNLIGVLVLGGAGLTAVRWFLKQDQ